MIPFSWTSLPLVFFFCISSSNSNVRGLKDGWFIMLCLQNASYIRILTLVWQDLDYHLTHKV